MLKRPVSEIIGKRSFPATGSTTTVRDAARIMKECHSSAVLVVENGVLAGICTERDVVFGVVAAGHDAGQTRVDAVMTRNVQTIGPEVPFGRALHLMYVGGFRHLPVVDHAGRPLGLLAAHDALDVDGLRMEEELVRPEEITVIL